MNDPPQPPTLSVAYSDGSEMALLLGRILTLVAPASMTAEQQEVWLIAALDALQGIRADEVRAIILELQRTVQRPNQIVPEIARLVSEKRARTSLSSRQPASQLFEIEREAETRRKVAKGQREIEEAWQWERSAKISAGLHVPPLEPPLSRDELANMTPQMRELGLSSGMLEYRDGMLVEARF
jgi:hypothetical protein